MVIDIDAELRILSLANVWDREGDLNWAEGRVWMTEFIRRIRRGNLSKTRDRISCEGCSRRALVKRGDVPEGWSQFGDSRFRRQNLGNWCPQCTKGAKGEGE